MDTGEKQNTWLGIENMWLGVGIVAVLAILAVGAYAFLKGSPTGAGTASAVGGDNSAQPYGAQPADNNADSKSSGAQSYTGPAQAAGNGNTAGQAQAIYDSDTGKEVPMPATDPGN